MRLLQHGTAFAVAALMACGSVAHAQDSDAKSKKPNILLIVSDDTGWGQAVQ